jgi:hypothetical protein
VHFSAGGQVEARACANGIAQLTDGRRDEADCLGIGGKI